MIKTGLLFMSICWSLLATWSWAQTPAGVDQLPDGAGKGLFVKHCVDCHALEVITQKRLSADNWRIVNTRMSSYGVDMSLAENEQITAYLAKNFGLDARRK